MLALRVPVMTMSKDLLPVLAKLRLLQASLFEFEQLVGCLSSTN